MSEKIYRVTVTLDVYGQTSKAAAAEFLEEALHVDGMIVVSETKPEIVKQDPA
jgi:hypothetical protein